MTTVTCVDGNLDWSTRVKENRYAANEFLGTVCDNKRQLLKLDYQTDRGKEVFQKIQQLEAQFLGLDPIVKPFGWNFYLPSKYSGYHKEREAELDATREELQGVVTAVKREANRAQNHEAKRRKNVLKAIREHLDEKDLLGQPIIKDPALIIKENDLPAPRTTKPEEMTLNAQLFNAKNAPKNKDEDRMVFKDIKQGKLACIFDGHAGAQASEYVHKHFPDCLEKKIEEYPTNPTKAFEEAFLEIHEQLRAINNHRPFQDGTTAGVAWIKDGKLYSACLADSVLKIYRKVNGRMVSIPLNPLRNWTSPKDEARALLRMEKEYQPGFLAIKYPKHRRVLALNVSRALGDLDIPSVSQKPKVSEIDLQIDDLIILASDGLWDFVKEEEIVKGVQERNWKKLPSYLGRLANVNTSAQRDDFSVIAIKVDRVTVSTFSQLSSWFSWAFFKFVSLFWKKK